MLLLSTLAFYSAFANDIDLSEIFDIYRTTDALSITMAAGSNPFRLHLTADFTVGLLLFSMVVGVNFKITMFGIPFSVDYFTEKYARNTGYFENAMQSPRLSTEINQYRENEIPQI